MRMCRFLIPFLLLGSVTLSAQKRITLLFAGDLMQHQAQIDAARNSSGGYDYGDCFTAVQPLVSEADLAIANLEVTLAGKPYRGYPAFSAPDAYLQAIKECGFDILLTANNHCLDRGRRGFDRTLLMLDSLSLLRAGTYRDENDRQRRYPLLIEQKGFRLMLLNYTYATNGLSETSPRIVNRIDRALMQRDIARARMAQPDAIIACMHWGTEYKTLPDDAQRQLARWLLSQGVTHVIGCHPHMVQPMELLTDSLGGKHAIVYSLGNFVFYMPWEPTRYSLMVNVDFEKGVRVTTEYVRIGEDGFPNIVEDVPKKYTVEYLNRLLAINEENEKYYGKVFYYYKKYRKVNRSRIFRDFLRMQNRYKVSIVKDFIKRRLS